MSEADRLHKAINSAAEKLPESWMVSIDVEGGYAGVSLADPFGEVIPNDDFTSCDSTLAEQIEDAIAYAITNDEEQ